MATTMWGPDDFEAWDVQSKRWLFSVTEHQLPDRFLDWISDLDSPLPALISGAVFWRVAEWYRARPERFVEWVPAEVFHPSSGDLGGWWVRWDRMQQAAGEAIRSVQAAMQREEEAVQYPTLDTWLAAASVGKVRAPAIPEPSARLLLACDPPRLRDYHRTRRAVRAHVRKKEGRS